MLVAGSAIAETRLLFSHYAAGADSVSLFVDQIETTPTLDFGATDTQYRLVEAGLVELSVRDQTGKQLAAADIAIGEGDHSVFFSIGPDGEPVIHVLEDALAAQDLPPPEDAPTANGNAVIRYLNFATFDREEPLAAQGQFGNVFVETGGQQGPFPQISRLPQGGGAAFIGEDPTTANSAVQTTIMLAVAIADSDSGPINFTEVLVSELFAAVPGSTDYVVIGGPGSQEIIVRPRPDNKAAFIDGLYGNPTDIGTGLQVYELRDIGRVYGLLYTFAEDGSAVWYLFDSRPNPDQGFSGTIPGLSATSGAYRVAFYEVVGPSPFGLGAPGNAEVVGVGNLLFFNRVAGEFLGDQFAQPDGQLFFHLDGPNIDDGIFQLVEFQRLDR